MWAMRSQERLEKELRKWRCPDGNAASDAWNFEMATSRERG